MRLKPRKFADHFALVEFERWMVPTYHQWMQDEELLTTTATEAMSLQQVADMQQDWRNSLDKFNFIVVDLDQRPDYAADLASPDETLGGKGLVGDIGCFYDTFREGNKYERGEFSFMIASKQFRRHGLGSAMVREVMEYAFTNLGTKEFEAKVSVENTPCINMLKKQGFAFESESTVFREVTFVRTISSSERRVMLPE